MPRLFVAVDLPEEVRDLVAGICSGIPGARWVPVEQLHLTLRFIGEVDDGAFAGIRNRLSAVKGGQFPMTIQGVGHFPPGRHPRVLWVGLAADEQLPALQGQIEREVVACALPPEDRRFSPHLTLARLKDPAPGKVEAFEARHARFAAGPFTVTEFHLYSSTLSNKGAIHRRECTYPLA